MATQLLYFCLENSTDWAWRATVCGVAKNWTRRMGWLNTSTHPSIRSHTSPPPGYLLLWRSSLWMKVKGPPTSIDQGDKALERTLNLLSGNLDSSPRFVIGRMILRKSLYLSEPSCTYLPKAESSKVLCVWGETTASKSLRLDLAKYPPLKAKTSFFSVILKTSPSKILKPASLIFFISSW